MWNLSKALAVGSVAMAVTVGMSGCSVFQQGSQKVATTDVSFMFMLWAPSGTLQPADSKGQSYNLTLHNPAPTATFFSDKPKRLAAQVTLSELVASWTKMGLAASVPLGAVTANEGSPTEQSMTGQLSDPTLDPTTGDISFTVEPTAATTQVATPTAFAAPVGQDNTLPATFNQVTLLIDPSNYQGVEYLVTNSGIVSLRETYAQGGAHPISVLPPITYIGPDYFSAQQAASVSK